MSLSVSVSRNLKEDLYVLIAELIRECVLFLLHLFDEGDPIVEFEEFQSQSRIINKLRNTKSNLVRKTKRVFNIIKRNTKDYLKARKSNQKISDKIRINFNSLNSPSFLCLKREIAQ